MRLIAAFLVLAVFASTAMAAETKPMRSITVSGQAERNIVPDEAHVGVNLNSLNVKMAEAKTDHDKKLSQLIAIVSKAGIDKSKVRTLSSSTQPQYDYVNNQRSFKGYRVQTQLDITVGDTGKVAELMDKITAAGFEKGANTEWGELLSLNYQIANPQAMRDALSLDAIKNAHDKAERMAKAAGASLGDVYQISEGSAPQMNFPRPMMATAKMEAADAAIAPPPGEQKVETTVNVTYELK